tara:strand:+ start:32331 stop:33632 length:1302 start_codon:yes stop_codon:yes gene_type:complete
MDKQNQVAQAIEELGGADTVREIANSIAIEGTYPIGVHARELLRDLLVGVVEMERKASADNKAARFAEAAMSKHEEAIAAWGKAARDDRRHVDIPTDELVYLLTQGQLLDAEALMRAHAITPVAVQVPGDMKRWARAKLDTSGHRETVPTEWAVASWILGLCKAASASEPAPDLCPACGGKPGLAEGCQCKQESDIEDPSAFDIEMPPPEVIGAFELASKPSAGLLAAAKDVISYRDSHHQGILCGRFAKIAKVLEQAIAAEEERGAEPTKVSSIGLAFRDQDGEDWIRADYTHRVEKERDQLRKEVAAAKNRAEKAEAELERLRVAIKGHCALLTGRHDHTGSETDCLGEVHTQFGELSQENAKLRSTAPLAEPPAEPTKRDDGPLLDQIDRQWINALFGLIERHNLDPARELQTVTGDLLASRERKGAPCP